MFLFGEWNTPPGECHMTPRPGQYYYSKGFNVGFEILYIDPKYERAFIKKAGKHTEEFWVNTIEIIKYTIPFTENLI